MAKVKEAKSGKSQNGEEAAATAAPSVEVLKDGEKGDPKEGAVLTVIQKRLRAANKKLKRVEEIEAARAAGKTLNTDQEEVLRGKAKVLGTIEELERLAPLLKEALVEERSLLETVAQSAAEESARATAAQESAAKIAELENEKAAAQDEAAAAKSEVGEVKQQLAELQAAPSAAGTEDAVARLIQLIYFALLFVDDGSHMHESERNACTSYDYPDETNTGQVLSLSDLTILSQLGMLITHRPAGQTLCHQEALARCKNLALHFLDKSQDPLPELNNMSAAYVADRLERLLTLGYVSVVPRVLTLEPQDALHPHSSTAVVGNGMYAAHDEQIYNPPASEVQQLNPTPIIPGFSSSAAMPPAHQYKVQESHGDFFPGHQQQASVFAPLLESSQGLPADAASFFPSESAMQAHQLQFMTESKVLEGAHMPHADSNAAGANGPAAPAMSAPHPEAANGFVAQPSNGPSESRGERGRGGGGRGGGYRGSGGPREARGGRGPPRGGRGGQPMGGGRGGAPEAGGRNGPGDFHRAGSRGGGGGRNMRGGRGGRGPPPGMVQPPPQHLPAYAT